jgi:hypothetical protein
MPAKIERTAITTSNSIKVKPRKDRFIQSNSTNSSLRAAIGRLRFFNGQLLCNPSGVCADNKPSQRV